MKVRNKLKSFLASLMAATMLISTVPTISYAAQINEYVDPADTWITSNGRSNELDFNATVTQETVWCTVCQKETVMLTYRVPEYTKSGTTALNRGVMYSDGTMTDGETIGNVDDGLPGVDASYTTYHWSKSVCQVCGTINSVNGADSYDFSRNVYSLHSCDYAFFLEFDNTTYEQYNDTYHTTILKKGEYCQFCKGTKAKATEQREKHDFTEIVDGQLGNNRFYVSEICDDCSFETSEYVTAKSVVASYYGTEDGNAHTVTVSDLSDSGVHTSIRYGTSANKCNLTSAPNYTEAGYYPVYYEIDYSYDGESMTENGVSYVWLLEEADEDDDSDDTIIVISPTHSHDYRYVETVNASCDSLGYERWQCDICGRLEKRNYTQALGHDYTAITIREATCKQGGLILHLCSTCGSFYEETTSTGSHNYTTKTVNPTCRITGYTEHICEVCGDNYITDITPIISHAFERITKEPTCTDKGYTTSNCTMCGLNYVSDYTESTGHNWDDGHTVTNSTCVSEGVIEYSCENCTEKMIMAESATGHTAGKVATCTEPQICTVCETVLELPTGHHYSSDVIEPTCTAMGYTVFTCDDCNDTYTGEYTDKAAHEYTETVTLPTCTEHGFTLFECLNCDDEYISDYTEKISHTYKAEITNPTCSAFGFTTYVCNVCGDKYISDYIDKTEHNYNKQTIEPTCTEHGYAIYTCPDCGKEFIADYTDIKQHTYTATVTDPTCTDFGFTTYVCSDCGDSYKAEYINALGHTPTEWIIDTPATIEHGGSKHIECSVCKETLQSAELPQLAGKDYSDEDGKAQIGAYSILLTDKDGKPVFNSEITIDINDKISINLPDGRLLDFADRTTITVFKTDTQAPVSDLNIFVADKNNNNATGITDTNGQLSVPAASSSTGDNNGTIGDEKDEVKNTYVVTVTDKTNIIIPNCDIKIGESNNIVVDLPDGIKPTSENPVIVTVLNHNGEAQKDITVIALGDADFVEKGITDIYGKITLPTSSEGFTDNDGKVNVDNINVIVNDETGVISNAYVKHNEDGTISVTLPDTKSISYANRITVTVLDSIAKPITGICVTVKDVAEKEYTAATDENGRIVVPPLSEDMTDENGFAVVNGYKVIITDEQKPIENAFIVIADNKISVKLPDGVTFDYANRITATITDNEDKAVKDMPVTFTDSTDNTETNLTDENGKATVPPIHIDYTDINGYAEVDGYSVTVTNEIGAVEKAFITHNAEVKNEDGTVKTAENISVQLPENVKFDYANRITVKVTNKADEKAVKDMAIIVSELAQTDVEAKTLNGITNAEGVAVFPPLTEDMTDGEGNSDVTEETTGKGEDTDGDGVEDKPGETVTTSYIVSVKNNDGIIADCFIEIKDGKVYVTLPETHTLTISNQTTVTITDNDGKAVSGVSVTVNDKTTSKTATTNSLGQITVPVKTSSGGGGGSSSGGSSGGGGGSYSSSSYTVTVVDKDNKTISTTKSTSGKTVTLTLPTGVKLTDDNYYTITVKKSGTVQKDVTVVLKDKSGNSVTGTTDKNGVIILPSEEHSAYIVGYDDGSFRPDNDMTRAEAAAIFARLIAERKGENISGKASFSDVSSKEWYYSYIGYLAKYDVVKGYTDGTFKPDESVTRAEFVSMTVRFYGLFDKVSYPANTTKYSDVSNSYWAVKDISFAKETGWLNGYADGTFKGDNNIIRAEVVTVVNRATGRNADVDYINKNLSILNKFTDLKNNAHWAYYDILESANTHKAAANSSGETWVK